MLVTIDVDFANPLRFPPHETAGIAVLRGSGSWTATADGNRNARQATSSGLPTSKPAPSHSPAEATNGPNDCGIDARSG